MTKLDGEVNRESDEEGDLAGKQRVNIRKVTKLKVVGVTAFDK